MLRTHSFFATSIRRSVLVFSLGVVSMGVASSFAVDWSAERAKEIGFRDSPLFVKTTLKQNFVGLDVLQFSLCGPNSPCGAITECDYSREELIANLETYPASDFRADAALLLSGSLLSSLPSCEFQKSFFIWLSDTRRDCRTLVGFPHCLN